jgi:hypothetical protein
MIYQAQARKSDPQGARATEPLKFSIGHLVKTTRSIDFEPHATITAGKTGRVIDIDSAGWVHVEWDQIEWGLGPWENCMWIEEPEACLKIIGKLDTPLAVSRWGRIEHSTTQKRSRKRPT